MHACWLRTCAYVGSVQAGPLSRDWLLWLMGDIRAVDAALMDHLRVDAALNLHGSYKG